MNSKDAIRSAANISMTVLNTYISDLSDADLFVRPGVGCNHIAWQLGHLMSSEVSLVNQACPGKGAQLPTGFAEKYTKETCGSNNPADFHTKQQLADTFQTVRAATLAALEAFPEAELDAPSPEWLRSMFPTMGDFFMLIATHPMMHAGQFVVVRRILGKPVLM